MTSADFVIRPYESTEALQRAVDQFVLDVGSLRVVSGSRLSLTAEEYVRAEVELVAPSEVDGVELSAALSAGARACGVRAEDLELVVAVVARRLKTIDLAVRLPLKDVDPDDHSFRLATASRRPIALRAPHGGCRIEVYVALSRQLERTALGPWRKGTWLGRAIFEVRTDLGSATFAPIPLDDNLRTHLGLSAGAVRYVEVEDPLTPIDFEHGIRMYVDAALLDALASAPATPAARSVQRQLFLDAMSAVVHRASTAIAGSIPAVEEVEGTLLSVLVDRAVGELSGDDRRDAADRVLRTIATEPNRFLAEIEGWVGGMAADMVKTLGADR